MIYIVKKVTYITKFLKNKKMLRKLEEIDTGESVKVDLKYSMNVLNANPFTQSLIIDARRIFTEEDERSRGVLIEATTFTKVFHNFSLRDNPILKLEPRALAVFVYLQYCVKESEHWVIFNRKEHIATTGMSDVTFNLAIDELIGARILNVTKYKFVYYINPQMFFAGNRIKRFPQNVNEVG